MNYKLYQGWTLGKGNLSWLISKVDRMPIKGAWQSSPFSHTYLRFVIDEDDWLYESFGLEGVNLKPYSAFQRAVSEGRVKKYEEILLSEDCDQVRAAFEKAKELHGDGYDFIHLFWLYLGIQHYRIRGKRPKNRVASTWDNRMTCNEFVQNVLCFVNLDPNKNVWDDWNTSSPHSQYRSWKDDQESKRWIQSVQLARACPLKETQESCGCDEATCCCGDQQEEAQG